jgi:hypothetical protein
MKRRIVSKETKDDVAMRGGNSHLRAIRALVVLFYL